MDAINTNANHTKTRIEYFDYLRIIAAFTVMLLHISTQFLDSLEITTYEWNVFNIFSSITRWAVPVFAMISGALFLDPEHDTKKLFSKNLLRLVSAFLFWSTIYAAIGAIQNQRSFFVFVGDIIQGHYHMWFIFMMIGMYLIVPLLRKFTETMESTKYFLMIALAFTFVLPHFFDFLYLISPTAWQYSYPIYDNFLHHLTQGYSSYFVLGYFLSKVDIQGWKEKAIYLLGTLGGVATIVLTVLFSNKHGFGLGNFYWNFAPGILFQSVAIFVLAKNKWNSLSMSSTLKNILHNLSKYSFGAYLVHVLILDQLDILFGINSLSFNPLFSVPVLGVVLFAASFAISGLLNKIPVLNKYIV